MFKTVFSVMENNQKYVNYLADTLVEIGDSVPEHIESCKITVKNPARDLTLFDVHSLPDDLFVQPGEKTPNRIGFLNMPVISIPLQNKNTAGRWWWP